MGLSPVWETVTFSGYHDPGTRQICTLCDRFAAITERDGQEASKSKKVGAV